MAIATYEFKINTTIAMTASGQIDKYIKHAISNILNQLPFTVEIVKHDEEPDGLCIKHTLHLEHPAFIEGAEIKDLVEYNRAIGHGEDGRIYAYNKSANLNYDEFIRSKK
jgi:hypothetical protein